MFEGLLSLFTKIGLRKAEVQEVVREEASPVPATPPPSIPVVIASDQRATTPGPVHPIFGSVSGGFAQFSNNRIIAETPPRQDTTTYTYDSITAYPVINTDTPNTPLPSSVMQMTVTDVTPAFYSTYSTYMTTPNSYTAYNNMQQRIKTLEDQIQQLLKNQQEAQEKHEQDRLEENRSINLSNE